MSPTMVDPHDQGGRKVDIRCILVIDGGKYYNRNH